MVDIRKIITMREMVLFGARSCRAAAGSVQTLAITSLVIG